MSLLCRLKKLAHKGLLKQEDLDRIIIIPKEQENKVIKMRDATPEERESINKYVNGISKLTGVSFENLEQGPCNDMVSRGLFEQIKWERDVAIEQLKELGYVLGQKIEPCEDCIRREFVEILVDYPPADLCTYPEYRGKPYFSIKYRENGDRYVGFGTYKIEVLSQYIKDYFMSNTQSKKGEDEK